MSTWVIVTLGVLGYSVLCALHAIAMFAIKNERMPLNSDDIIIFAEQEYKCQFVFIAYPVIDALFMAAFAFVVLSSLIAEVMLWLIEKTGAKNT